MRDIRNAPFFLRLGARLRGPAGTSVGRLKRVIISNVICVAPTNDMPAIIAGIPGYPVQDVSVRDVFMVQKGGASAAIADIDPPELEREYPEPSSFGPLPAQGLLVRHAKDIAFHHIEITSIRTDARPFVWLSDVDGADFSRLNLSPWDGVPALRLHETRNLRVSGSRRLPDILLNRVTDGELP